MKPITIGVIVIVTSFLFLFFFSIIWQPVATEITQDRPITKFLCETQMGCGSGVGPHRCTDEIGTEGYKRLSRWDGFNGCNNNTIGYRESDGRIVVESCVCGGLM